MVRPIASLLLLSPELDATSCEDRNEIDEPAEFSLDAARAVLGHRSPAITEVYADLDIAKAAEVMGRLG